jgi:glycosyltransferase involved in cell wall biosynthesis
VRRQLGVSVCIATYNGARYLQAQLASILEQLGEDDEVIVVDDNSGDGTWTLLQSVADPRVRVLRNERKLGHVRNFERAMALADRELVFLSDQDDLWAHNKLRCVVECFARHPEVQLVHHALSTMDPQGNTLSDVWNPLEEGMPSRVAFLARQLVKCQVFGCAVAFCRSLLDVALPFPTIAYAHDHWLAAAAGVCGRVYFLNRPLVRYRQHEANLTPKRGLNWTARINVRLKFFGMIGIAICRRFRPLIEPAIVAR